MEITFFPKLESINIHLLSGYFWSTVISGQFYSTVFYWYSIVYTGTHCQYMQNDLAGSVEKKLG